MPTSRLNLALLLLLGFTSCSGAEAENEEARLEDFRNRAQQYYNSGRYPQAFQQARLGLEIDDQDGGLNLIAGRALVMQRELTQVSRAFPFLEVAQEELDSYKADYSLGECYFRYGSMLYSFAQKEKQSLIQFPDADSKSQESKLAECSVRVEKAEVHFRDALVLFNTVLETVPDDLQTLEKRGQTLALLGKNEAAATDLERAIGLLTESRQYKNHVLATDSNLTVQQEDRVRRDLDGDIKREIAIRFLMAGLLKRTKDVRAEEEQYTIILGLDPNTEVAYHSRALCRYELGRLAEASADMHAFVGRTDLEFDTPQVQQAMRIIEEYSTLQGA
ncbi:MAG: hypothetical protein O3A95_01615 [Planctomycetota bacterium]|nr:hypothetical protein [Planctomycetota bacterium]MDA1112983.1 hypothetical protein [Planctomycetota bacterium]